VVNCLFEAFILALALCLAGMTSPQTSLRRDFLMALLVPVPVAVGALGFVGHRRALKISEI